MKKRVFSVIMTAAIVLLLTPTWATAYHTGRAGEYPAISVGDNISLAIKSDNSLWAWGSSGNAIFGEQSGPLLPRSTPGKVMDDVRSISSGAYHTLIIKTDGTLWAVGDPNGDGLVGDGTTEPRYTPVKIMDHVAAASTGQYCSFAIKTDGTLWAWGRNYVYALGDGTEIDRHAPVKVLDNVKAVSSSAGNTMAVKTDGTLWAWGDKFYRSNGASGLDHTPVKIMDNIKDVAMGTAVSVVLKEDGTVWTFNGMPKPGPNTPNSWDMAVPIQVLDNVTEICSGYTHALALKTDGSLWSWSTWGKDNDRGQLGNGTTEGSDVPTKILDNVVEISAGGDHNLAVKKDGSLWSWGYNGLKQIGDGTTKNCLSPIKVLDGVRVQSGAAAAPAGTAGFSDVPADAYYASAVKWAVEKKITTGKTAEAFGPGDTCATAQILTFLWRANGRPNENGTERESVTAWANSLGIDTSSLDAPCTRAAAAMYMWKASRSPEPKAPASFQDVSKGADYADAVAWAVEKGITGGTSATAFSPDVICTRGQIVTFLYRGETGK